MTPSDLLLSLEEKGVSITISGERLKVDAPVGVLTPELRCVILNNKTSLMDLMSQRHNGLAQSPRATVISAPPTAADRARGDATLDADIARPIRLKRNATLGEPMANDLVIVQLDRARQALAEAKTIQETKRADDAARVNTFIQRQKYSLEIVRYGNAIEVEALAQLGKMLEDAPKNRGTRGQLAGRDSSGGSKVERPENDAPSYAEIGLDSRTAMLAQDVAKLPTSEKDKIKAGKLTIRRAVTHHKREQKGKAARAYSESVKNNPVLQKKYNVVLADPPWEYSAQTNTKDATTDLHYATLDIDQICSYLSDKKIQVADDAVLFLWVTNPFVLKALRVVEAWGFEYKTNIVWEKTELKKPGVGYYVRGRHELLYICTRGKFTPLDDPKPPIGSVLASPVREHSRKPDEVYDIISKLYPDCVCLELFARQTREGWDALGAELDARKV